MKAAEFGEKYGSCLAAMTWRKSLPPEATQADAYLDCKDGAWTLWQLQWVTEPTPLRAPLERAAEKIVGRAVGRCDLEHWVSKWLSGEDRSLNTAAQIETNTRPSVLRYAAAAAADYVRALQAANTRAVLGNLLDAVDHARRAAWERAGTSGAIVECALQADDIREFIPVWPGE
jgi:hypothetical protein